MANLSETHYTLKNMNFDFTQNKNQLQKWVEQRKLHSEVSLRGERVTSVGKWYAWDKGQGVVTDGVNNCVGIAHAGDIGLLAHIAAHRHPTEESGANSFPALVDALQTKGVTHVDLFGIPGELIKEIRDYLNSKGISCEIHLNPDKDKAFIIVIKGKKMDFWTE